MNITSKSLLASIADKVVWQFIEAYLGVLLVGNQLDWSQNQMALAAGVSAVVTLALAAVNGSVIPANISFYADLGLRFLRGGASVFLATLLLEPDILSIAAWESAGSAAIAGLAIVIKGAASKRIGNTETAAMVSARLDPIEATSWPTPPPGD